MSLTEPKTERENGIQELERLEPRQLPFIRLSGRSDANQASSFFLRLSCSLPSCLHSSTNHNAEKRVCREVEMARCAPQAAGRSQATVYSRSNWYDVRNYSSQFCYSRLCSFIPIGNFFRVQAHGRRLPCTNDFLILGCSYFHCCIFHVPTSHLRNLRLLHPEAQRQPCSLHKSGRKNESVLQDDFFGASL